MTSRPSPPTGPGDLRKLRHFVVVAETRNFTRAAERLHMAQQALSGSIGRLERELGVRLFDRDTRHVSLTDAGRALYEQAPALLDAFDAAWHSTRRAGHAEPQAPLRVGRTPALSGEEVLDLLAPLRRAHPEIAIAVVQCWPDEIAPQLRSGALGIAFARAVERSPDVESRPLRGHGQRLAVAVHREDELAAVEHVRLADLASHELVLWGHPDRSAYARYLLDRCHDAGLSPTFRITPTQGTSPLLAVDRPGEFAFVSDAPGRTGDHRILSLDDAPEAPVRVLTHSAGKDPGIPRYLAALAPAQRERRP